MNKEVTRSLLFRLWSVVSGFVVALAVPLFLTPDQQGTYYTFASLIGIQVFFELGLGQVLVFRFARLDSLVRSGDEKTASRRGALLLASRIVYRWLAISFVVVGTICGCIFFKNTPSAANLLAPWSLLVLATSINLAHTAKLSYLEACGGLRHVAISRLKASIISTFILLLALGLGAGLWSICVTPIVNAVWFTFWIYSHPHAQSYREGRDYPALDTLSIKRIWAADIFPMQWKISLSWISGYLIFQLYTPVVYSQYGSIEAGRVGYTMTILTAILLVSTTFTSALAPRLSSLFSSSSFIEYNKLFNKSLVYSSVCLFFLLSASVVLSCLSSSFRLPYSDRLLPSSSIALFAGSVFCSGVISCLSIYLRSQQKEPLLFNSVVTAAAMAIAILVASKTSITAVLLASFLVNLSSLVWAVIVFLSSRRSVILAAMGQVA